MIAGETGIYSLLNAYLIFHQQMTIGSEPHFDRRAFFFAAAAMGLMFFLATDHGVSR